MYNKSNISFFIPAYNCSATITEAVESILETNFIEGDELIIVNDCSTDNTSSVLNHLKKKYPAIVVFEHKFNRGGAAARNTAVENSRNELLFCLDSDNVLMPLSIAPLKKYLVENNADVVSFQHQQFFTADKFTPDYTWSLPAGQISVESHLKRDNTPGQHGNYLFTLQSWIKAKGYAEGCSLDTWTFGMRQAITGAKIMVLENTGYYHRLSENSYWMRENEAYLWANSIKATFALFPFFDRIDEDFLTYMLGKGKYLWFYTLKTKPMVIVAEGAKNQFHNKLQQKIRDLIYPKPSIFARVSNKIKRIIKNS